MTTTLGTSKAVYKAVNVDLDSKLTALRPLIIMIALARTQRSAFLGIWIPQFEHLLKVRRCRNQYHERNQVGEQIFLNMLMLFILELYAHIGNIKDRCYESRETLPTESPLMTHENAQRLTSYTRTQWLFASDNTMASTRKPRPYLHLLESIRNSA